MFEKFGKLLQEMFKESNAGAVFSKETVTTWSPKMDVKEDDDYFLVQIELPGVSPEDIDLHIEDGVLWVTGSRMIQREVKNDNTKTHIRERHIENFKPSIKLGPLCSDNIKAKLIDGVLNISIPKMGTPKIDITVE